jgi:hypothetical protein
MAEALIGAATPSDTPRASWHPYFNSRLETALMKLRVLTNK